ncbi:MAG: hypothetical protein GWN16_04050 [Calditrichae bacterium]|nr:hypothetical protein [Calditrichia bacterium]
MLIFIIGCTSSSKVTTSEPSQKAEPRELDESFDPVQFNDEDIDFPAEGANNQTVEPLPLPEDEPQKIQLEENRKLDGFRVQLFATKEIEKATLEKKEAEYLFFDDSVAVYIEFDSPMYKVRIGDCRNREQAESLRQLARRKGYPTAWIVKTKINTNPNLPENVERNTSDFQ